MLTTTLTLICISCAVNKIDPKLKIKTNPKENTKDFENKSKDLEPLKEKHPEATASKLEKILKSWKSRKQKKLQK
nr:complement regulator-acquiring protein [Borreliella garinii]